jgi:hypothetical protein
MAIAKIPPKPDPLPNQERDELRARLDLQAEIITAQARQVLELATHLRDLLHATATRTQGGLRSATECLACERTGVHGSLGACHCVCHMARTLLAQLDGVQGQAA